MILVNFDNDTCCLRCVDQRVEKSGLNRVGTVAFLRSISKGPAGEIENDLHDVVVLQVSHWQSGRNSCIGYDDERLSFSADSMVCKYKHTSNLPASSQTSRSLY